MQPAYAFPQSCQARVTLSVHNAQFMHNFVYSFGRVYFGSWLQPSGKELNVAVKVRLESNRLAKDMHAECSKSHNFVSASQKLSNLDAWSAKRCAGLTDKTGSIGRCPVRIGLRRSSPYP